MKVLYAPNYEVKEESVVAFGKFDGVHKGHVKLINTLVEQAQLENRKSIIYTFQNHPKAVLEDIDFELLMDEKTKIDKLNDLDVDIIIFENFDKNFANITAEEFVKNILIEKLNAKKIVIGSNSTFGKNSEGNVKLLKTLSVKYNFEVIEVPLFMENGKIVSSSEIRKELALRGGNDDEIF